MLVHLNRLLGTDFAPEDFRHEARVLDDPWRVGASCRSAAGDGPGRRPDVWVGAGESIHTDNAYKHGLEEFRALAHEAGWTLTRCWLAPDGLTSLHLLRP